MPPAPPDPRRAPGPALALVVLGVVALPWAGCAVDPGPPLVEYVDLVTEDPQAPLGEEARAFQRLCGEETRFGRPGSPGEPIVVDLELGADPVFVLGACRQGPGPASLTATVSAEGDAREVLELDLSAPRAEWERAELDLARLAGRSVEIRLDTAAPEGSTLWISDAFVRQRRPPEAASGPPVRPGRRILMISIDTWRAEPPTAEPAGPAFSLPPALARLAEDSETFSPHVAGSSWTKPSHATLLTGQPVGVHGAGTMDGPIRPGVPTLAERLSAAGLATGGAVHDCVWLDPKFGFGRGFDDYRSRVWGTGQLARATTDWIAGHRDEPFFFFLHTFEAHSDFWQLPYEGVGATRRAVRRRFGVRGYGCREGQCASSLLTALGDGRVAPLPREAEILRHLYGGGVASVDAELGRLFEDLRAMGLYDDLLVVVTSDHGEMLLEHGATLHGSWWEQVLRVPLIVKWPGNERAGVSSGGRTSAMDLVPTLLAMAGLPADPELPGRDLRLPGRRPVVAENGWLALYDGPWKAVVGAEEGDRLYDLETDPGETRDLAAERPAELERLAAAAAAWRESGRRRVERLGQRRDGVGSPGLTPEDTERLRALGYLGGGG